MGSILKSKNNPKESYVKISENVELKKGETLTLQDPRKFVDFLVEGGHLSEEDAAERKSKIPDYVRYNLVRISNKA